MAEQGEDEELAAIKTVLEALSPLKAESRSSVIDYVFRRLGIAEISHRNAVAPAPHSLAMANQPASPVVLPMLVNTQTDLRSLTEQKQPKTASQMVAVLAYYLANLAPEGERREHIVSEDIKKYFVQANFELPTGPHNMTLVHAKNAGYLDSAGTGKYRLNPVGHNLVTHKLPLTSGKATGTVRRQKKALKKTKKKF